MRPSPAPRSRIRSGGGRHHVAAPLFVVVVLALAGAGCSNGSEPTLSTDGSAPEAADFSTTTDPLAEIGPEGAPRVGTCRPVLTTDERTAAYEQGETAQCSAEHGAEVVATFEVPDATAAEITAEAIESNSTALQDAVAETAASCSRPAQEAIDEVTDLDLEGTPFFEAAQHSVLRGVWFLPSPDEWEAGERWLVCQVAAVDPAGESVAFTDALGELGRGSPLPPELGACVDDGLQAVTCTGTASRVVASGRIRSEEPPLDDVEIDGCETLADRLALDATVDSDRPLQTRTSLVADETYEVFCLVPGPDPVPVT